ncbi:MAG TPA: VOC family protein [Candidatus Acidoferrum sp.]|nr:VOC family protein [Candidatus Acidoferrum sp.]
MRRILFALITLVCCVFALANDPPKRPRIFGIAQVQFFAGDLRASNDFYGKVLNLMQPTNCEGGCDKLPPPRLFSINGRQMLGISPASPHAPTNRIEEITFATDDVPALRRYLEFYKIALSKPQKSADNYLSVMDPEGHRIGFRQWSNSFLEPQSSSSQGSTALPILIHAGIIVRDRQVEDRFYQDVLGFHVYWHGGMKDDQTDWVDMQVPDGTGWIEYMLNVPGNADKHLLGVMNHIALGVPDVRVAAKELEAKGMKLSEPPQIGRDGKWQLNLYDPDGTRVELMEFTPVEKPCCSEYTGPHPKP